MDEAARLERRSISSYIANVVIEAANSAVTKNRGKTRTSWQCPGKSIFARHYSHPLRRFL